MSKRQYRDFRQATPQIVRIEKLGFYGEGVGRSESGEVYFVSLGAPGDLVRVQPIKQRKQYIEAEVLEIIEASPDRITPPCKLFGLCGGCQLQHLRYDVQVEQKRQQLAHWIERNLAQVLSVEARACEQPYGYRRRVRMRQRQGQVGFFQRKTHDFQLVTDCEVAHPAINVWIQDPSHFPRPETPYDISLDVDDEGRVLTYEGPEQQHMGFRQANPWGEKNLQQLLAETLQDETRNILELYAGEGALLLPWLTLKNTQQYLGVDSDPVNIDQGRKKHGRDNARFEVGNLPVWLIKREIQEPEFLSKFPVLVLDPPRCGMGDNVKHLQTLSLLKKIIYISCDVTSWTQDVKVLMKQFQFDLRRVVMVDMFPQTRHFEIFSVLEPAEQK